MKQKPFVSYASQFALLLGFLGVCIIISSLLMGWMAAQALHKPFLEGATALLMPENANLARLLNTISTCIAFFIPAWLVAKIANNQSFVQLGFSKAFSVRQLSIVVLISITALFVSGSLGALNEIIPMPASFLKKAKQLEDTYKSAMLSMATMHSFLDYILSLLVIALAPAIFEEVLFRGSMQQILIGWTKNIWIGIIITSIIFSAIHGSYFGFLPRLGLGIILGLVFYISKNLWLSIAMHFLNNALVVTQIYILTKRGESIEKAIDESMPIWLGAIALIGLFFLFKYYKKVCDQVINTNKLTQENETLV